MRMNWKWLVCSLAMAASVLTVAHEANAQKNGAGSGQTRVGATIDDWDLGVGQPQDNFTTAERYGIKIGLRPVERFGDFSLPLQKKGQTGIYTVPTGTAFGGSAWGYSIYVNVENAFGAAEGTTLDDYDIVVTQDYDFLGNWFGETGLDSTKFF